MKFLKFFCYFLFSFSLLFLSGFYLYYLYKYPKLRDKSHLLKYYPKDLILKTGGRLNLPEERSQHFLNFSHPKQPKTIRIGAFGDSHTFGSEVEKTESYPYQLQELFNQNFPKQKIEVLNFGIDGVSFQEQFLLWEKYAGKYDLDYILLGPRGFYSDRDLTFRKNFGWSFKHFQYPRARFILSHSNKLNQVHVNGNTLERRYKNYYSLLPSWTTLLYDKKPFQVWEIFFPFLRNNLINLFYYKNFLNDDTESSQINILLLEQIKNLHNNKILFFTDFMNTFNNYQSAKVPYNLNYIPFPENRLYRMFATHKSSLGNEFIAKTWFYALTGRKDFSLKIIDCYFKKLLLTTKALPPPKTKIPDKYLNFVKSIQMTDGNTSILTLRHSFDDHHHNNKGSYSKSKIKGTRSFITFSRKDDFMKSPFYALPVQLKEGMKVHIRLADKSRVDLGSIRYMDTHKRFFVFHGEYIKFTRYNLYFLLRNPLSFFGGKFFKNSPMELFVGDYRLGLLQPRKNFTRKELKYPDLYNLSELQLPDFQDQILKFIPVEGNQSSFMMMGMPSGHIREKNFPDEFPLYIQYDMENGESFKSLLPNWRCRKETHKIHLDLPDFEPLNPGSSQASVDKRHLWIKGGHFIVFESSIKKII